MKFVCFQSCLEKWKLWQLDYFNMMWSVCLFKLYLWKKDLNNLRNIYVCMCIYIYMYIHTQTHTKTHTQTERNPIVDFWPEIQIRILNDHLLPSPLHLWFHQWVYSSPLSQQIPSSFPAQLCPLEMLGLHFLCPVTDSCVVEGHGAFRSLITKYISSLGLVVQPVMI